MNSRPLRLLLVDDEPSIRATLPLVLERELGAEVRVAATVAEAVENIRKYNFDALLSDLNIGSEEDGFEVVLAMKKAQPDCVNFIVTGYPAFETAVRGIREQIADYFTKPADLDAMVNSMREKIERSRRGNTEREAHASFAITSVVFPPGFSAVLGDTPPRGFASQYRLL